MSIDCAFGAYLNEALRDRFVCGLRAEAIQRRLLSESNLTLTKALETAQGMEAAAKKAQQFKGTETAIQIEKVTRATGSSSGSAYSPLWEGKPRPCLMPLQGSRMSQVQQDGAYCKGLPLEGGRAGHDREENFPEAARWVKVVKPHESESDSDLSMFHIGKPHRCIPLQWSCRSTKESSLWRLTREQPSLLSRRKRKRSCSLMFT